MVLHPQNHHHYRSHQTYQNQNRNHHQKNQHQNQTWKLHQRVLPSLHLLVVCCLNFLSLYPKRCFSSLFLLKKHKDSYLTYLEMPTFYLYLSPIEKYFQIPFLSHFVPQSCLGSFQKWYLLQSPQYFYSHWITMVCVVLKLFSFLAIFVHHYLPKSFNSFPRNEFSIGYPTVFWEN